MFGKLSCLKALEMNENSETGYIFRTKIPKPVENKGILWASPRQVEVKCPPPQEAIPCSFFHLQWWMIPYFELISMTWYSTIQKGTRRVLSS